MPFVKQCRSCSLGVQSRLSNLGLRGDRYYRSKVLFRKKKSSLCPLDSRDFIIFLTSFTDSMQKKCTCAPTQQLPHILTGCHSFRSQVLFILCVVVQTGRQSFSPCSPFILCAHTLNRCSPFDSVPFLPLSFWASASSYPSILPPSPMTPFSSRPCCDSVVVFIELCRVLHLTYDFNLQKPLRYYNWFIGIHAFDVGKKIECFFLFFLCHSGHTVTLPSLTRLWQGNIPVWPRNHSTRTWRRQAQTGHISLPKFRWG